MESDIRGNEEIFDDQKVRLYAQYEETSYSITYVTYGGTLPEDALYAYYYGHKGGYDLPVAYMTGDTFLGWYLDASYKKKIERISESDYGDLTLYARWKNNDNKSYTVHFVADYPAGVKGGSGSMRDLSMKYNVAKALTKNGFKLKGYAFKGWSLLSAKERASVDESAITYYGDQETVTGFEDPAGEIRGVKTYRSRVNLYAIWEKETYTVSLYNLNAEYVEDAVWQFTYNVDQKIVFDGPRRANSGKTYIGDENEDTQALTRYLAEPCRLGDTFRGWYSDKNFRRKVTGISAGTTGDKIFYARWAATHYTINYNLNAGGDPTAVLDTSKAGYVTSYGDKYESGYLLATASRKGWGFGGWYKEASCKNAVGNIIKSPYVDMTVYAKWIPCRFDIVFDGNSSDVTGSTPGMLGLSIDSEYTLTGNGFERAGYEFTGWNISSLSPIS